MASAAFFAWSNDGKPYRLMHPAAALQSKLEARGLTVYDYPNEAHQKANPPEDHTAYSASGWPVKSAYGIGHAIDIMPRSDTAAGRAENAAIARTLIADRNAGVPGVLWIKYLNWTDEQGAVRQERWMPNHTTQSSSDAGHIHVSGRSDCDNDVRADNYDPLATNMEEDMPGVQEGDQFYNDMGYGIAALLAGEDVAQRTNTGAPNTPVSPARPNKLAHDLATIKSQVASNGSGLTSVMSAISALTAKVDALATGTGQSPEALEGIVRKAIRDQGDDNPAT